MSKPETHKEYVQQKFSLNGVLGTSLPFEGNFDEWFGFLVWMMRLARTEEDAQCYLKWIAGLQKNLKAGKFTPRTFEDKQLKPWCGDPSALRRFEDTVTSYAATSQERSKLMQDAFEAIRKAWRPE